MWEAALLQPNGSKGWLAFDASQAGGGAYDLRVRSIGSTGEQDFVHRGVVINSSDTHYLDYGIWDGLWGMTLYVDHGSDGTIDETLVLVNQVPRLFLPLISR